jgi:hypothetical protein
VLILFTELKAYTILKILRKNYIIQIILRGIMIISVISEAKRNLWWVGKIPWPVKVACYQLFT